MFEVFIRITVAIAIVPLSLWGYSKLDDLLDGLPPSLYTLLTILSASATIALVLIIWYICWVGKIP